MRPHALGSNFRASMTIPSIAGDGTPTSSTDIAFQSWSWGMTKPTDLATSLSTGKTKITNLTIDKAIDTASPLLMQACALGTNLKTVTIHLTPTGEGDTAVIVMTGARVESINDSGAPGGGSDETVSFAFQKITIDYTSSLTLKVTHFGWDVAANKKV